MGFGSINIQIGKFGLDNLHSPFLTHFVAAILPLANRTCTSPTIDMEIENCGETCVFDGSQHTGWQATWLGSVVAAVRAYTYFRFSPPDQLRRGRPLCCAKFAEFLSTAFECHVFE
jgi:hypothetical protein